MTGISYEIEVGVQMPGERKTRWVLSQQCPTLKNARNRQKDYDRPTRIVRVTRKIVKEVEIR